MIERQTHTSELDAVDRSILEALQSNGRMSNVELAKGIHLSPAATHTRLRRLEREGFIDGYSARLNRQKLGFHMLCYINISLQTHASEELERFRRELRKMPEVLECCLLTGEFDYLAKVILRDQNDLEHFIVKRLATLPGVAKVNTSVVVAEIKSAAPLPIQKDETLIE